MCICTTDSSSQLLLGGLFCCTDAILMLLYVTQAVPVTVWHSLSSSLSLPLLLCWCRTQFKRAPVNQILFLRNRASSKLRGCGTLVTSDHGQPRLWDLFGPDEPLGSFPLTQTPEEQVVALSTDRENHVLVAGDTAGLIAVFDMKDYCMVTGKVSTTMAKGSLLQLHC